ncbi:MAG: chemotaxis protein CheX [Planctomycetes bacterium]|nr:chemotaxis protein CheX [Planctomycetota bacterium]
MNFESVDLRILVENVFATTLGMTVTPVMANDEWPVRRAAVAIRGSWSGRVVVAATDAVLRSTVASMCHVHPHECGESDLTDALLELTNVLGGSVKSLLPEDCRLGLPEILSTPPTGSPDADRTFRCDGEPVRLWVEGAATA